LSSRLHHRARSRQDDGKKCVTLLDSKRSIRGERLQIMLSPEELAAVDDFRFQQRMPSRAAAVRELFRLGLASAG
jgi:hypothetical protein